MIHSGNIAGYELLYSKYSASLFGIICRTIKDRSIAEKLFVEAFNKIFTRLDSYDGKTPFFIWALNITRETVIQYACDDTALSERIHFQDKKERLHDFDNIFWNGYKSYAIAVKIDTTPEYIQTSFTKASKLVSNKR